MASIGECPRVTETDGAHNFNDGDCKYISDTTKILNIPIEFQNDDDETLNGSDDNFVEVICEKENGETYSSTSTRSLIDDGEIGTNSFKEFNTLNGTLHELDDFDQSKNFILLNLQSNLKNPSSLHQPVKNYHDYIIERMSMEESTV